MLETLSTSRSGRQGRALAALAVLASLVVACGGGDDASSADVQEFRPVEVVGNPLPAFEGETTTDSGIGSIAPVLNGQSFDGTAVTIAPDGYSLVVFLAHWCPHCQAEVPDLVEWAESLSVPAGLTVYGVTTSTGEDRPNYPPSRWLSLERWPFVTMADDESFTAGQAFGTTGYPYVVMLDPSGAVMWRHSGELADGQLEQYIATAMGL